MKYLTYSLIILCSAAWAWAAEQDRVQSWSAGEVKEIAAGLFDQMGERHTHSLGTTLGKWDTHAALIAVRSADGVVEVHRDWTDIIVVLEGEATLVTGGTLVNATEKGAGEVRATAINGGESRVIRVGDMVHIPPGVPHQMLIKGRFTCYGIKVRGRNAAKP